MYQREVICGHPQLPDAINLKINFTFSQLRPREPRTLKQLLAEFSVTFFVDDDKRYMIGSGGAVHTYTHEL